MLQTAGQHHEREEYEPLLYGTSAMLVADKIWQLAEAASGPTMQLAKVASFSEHKSSGSGSPFQECVTPRVFKY